MSINLRMTLTLDIELTDQMAMEKYGSADPYTVAMAAQAHYQRELSTERFGRDANVKVEPRL